VLTQIVLFYGFVLRARLALGRWPVYSHPDPKDLGFPIFYTIVMLGGFVTFLTPLFAALLLAVAKWLGVPRHHLVVSAVIFGACYLSGVVLCAVDPGKFGDWFLD
jgi:hypothetical protein